MRRRRGTPHNFFQAFTEELEKQIFKKLWKLANKKQNNSNITMLHLKKTEERKASGDIILQLCTKNFYDMINSS